MEYKHKERTSGSFGTHRVRHRDSGVWHESDFAFTGQIYINNPVAIEADLQFLVRPQIMIFPIFIRLTNNTFKEIDIELEIGCLQTWSNGQV